MLKKPTYEELEKRVQELERAEFEHQLVEQEQLMVFEVLKVINSPATAKCCWKVWGKTTIGASW